MMVRKKREGCPHGFGEAGDPGADERRFVRRRGLVFVAQGAAGIAAQDAAIAHFRPGRQQVGGDAAKGRVAIDDDKIEGAVGDGVNHFGRGAAEHVPDPIVAGGGDEGDLMGETACFLVCGVLGLGTGEG